MFLQQEVLSWTWSVTLSSLCILSTVILVGLTEHFLYIMSCATGFIHNILFHLPKSYEVGTVLINFTDMETEAQIGYVICLIPMPISLYLQVPG